MPPSKATPSSSSSTSSNANARTCKGLAVVMVVGLFMLTVFWPAPEMEEDLIDKSNAAGVTVVIKPGHTVPMPTMPTTSTPIVIPTRAPIQRNEPLPRTEKATAPTITRPTSDATTTSPPTTTSKTTTTTTTTTQQSPTTHPSSISKNTKPRICQSNAIPLPGDKSLDVWFTCQGPVFDAYMPALLQEYYHSDINNNNATTTLWGKQSLPPNARILLLGNGHMRQIGQVLACQQEQHDMAVTALRRLDKYATELTYGGINTTLVMVTNTYASFSPNWKALLEQQLQRPLTDFTTIVLGLVDECNRDATASRVNSFTKSMQALEMPGVDCIKYNPPTLQQWYNVTSNNNNSIPLVFVSPLTTARRSQARQALHTWQRAINAQQQQQQQPTLGFIYARKYVDKQQDCMAMSRSEISDCIDKASTGNPCQGAAGGWADLVVWDVVDFLWAATTPTTPTTTLTTATTITRDNGNKNAYTNWPAALGTLSSSSKPWQSLPPIRDDVMFCQSPVLQAPADIFADQSDIHYQCAGPLYNQLIRNLHPFARDQSIRRLPAEHWGKRQFALPTNKRVLFYGNSHTRQVAKALACQQMELQHLTSVVSINTTRVHQFDYRNDATMVVVTNTFAPYSKEWIKLTEDEMGMRLDSFDALVLGAFNNCQGDNAFSREMRHYSEIMPNVDCINTPAPSLTEIAQHYAGPIIYVTMFVPSSNEQSHDVTRQEIQVLRDQHNRTNVHFVEARQYIDVTRDCRGQERFNVSDCYPKDGTGGPTHECTGHQGGHADLIAWDVIEQLYREIGCTSQ